MADTKISALTAASTLGGTEELAGVQSAANVKITPAQIKTYAESNPIALAPPSLTGSSATSSLDITQTWNTTGTPTALKVAVTDTASNASSLLMDLRVGGASKFKVTKAGGLTLSGDTTGSGGGYFGGFVSSADGIGFVATSSNAAQLSGGSSPYLRGRSEFTVQWSSTVSYAGTADLILARDAANTLALRNSTNAQAFNVYNTYTDASNYERARFAWESNILTIGPAAAGTGTTTRATLIYGGTTTNSIYLSQFNMDFKISNTSEFAIMAAGACVNSSNYIGFSSGAAASSGADTALARNTAGVVVLTDGSTGTGYLKHRPVAVASLPSAATVTVGTRGFVNDASAPTFGATVAGGGAVATPVYSDGTDWKVG